MADTKEKPIPLRQHEVRATLEGRKTQTRRIVKVTGPGGDKYQIDSPDEEILTFDDGTFHYLSTGGLSGPYPCPYGQPGDRLWVRETFSRTNPGGDDGVYFYKADGKFPDSVGGKDYTNVVWRPCIHMPRTASRILLEITDVRVERLQDISGEDAFSEGIKIPVAESSGLPLLRLTGKIPPSQFIGKHPNEWDLNDYARFEYAQLWERINGPGSWEENPWVWVIGFKVVEVKG